MKIRFDVFAVLMLLTCGSLGCSTDSSTAKDATGLDDSSADAAQDIRSEDGPMPDLGDDTTTKDLGQDLGKDVPLEDVADVGPDTEDDNLVPPDVADVADVADVPDLTDTTDTTDTTDIPDVGQDVPEDIAEDLADTADVVVPCEDTNPDPCKGFIVNEASECVPVNLTGGACDDLNDCTKADTCQAGLCVGEAYLCDDQDLCTTDHCKGDGECGYEYNTLPCDDNDPCTTVDSCTLGSCVGTASNCDCKVNTDCGVLEDSNLCNGTLYCDTSELPYVCKVDPSTIKTCPSPTGPASECQISVCTPSTGACSFAAGNDGVPCEDNLFCTKTSVCGQGQCQPGPEPCPAGDQCFGYLCVEDIDTCVIIEFDGLQCTDGNACTTGDECYEGECTSTGTETCNDNNICTDNQCNPLIGCEYPPNNEPCTDNNKCTIGDSCGGGKCIPGSPLVCNDNVACTEDLCVPESGCTAITHNEACHDADACTIGEFCTATGCQSASTATCSVNWPGIDSICDPDLGCVSEAIACGNGTVQFGEQCDDGNEFADDGCNPECQIEGQSFAPSLWASDVDVDGHGTLAMVGMYTPEGATVQCARPLIGWVSTKTTWAAAPQDLNVSSDEPWVVRAGKSGATMMVWRHYTVPNDYTSIRLDVRYVDATCEVFSPMVRISDTFSNEFYDMDIDDNGNGVVAFNANNRGYLRFFGPDGTPSPANLELPGPNCKFGTHVALSSLGNGGVVSCQGDLDEGVVFWTFDGNGKLTSLATPVPGAAGHTSWYDSHNVYMTGTGGFVIVNADPMTGETRAASFNHLGELVKAETVFFNQAPPSFCYDTYRFGRIKNLEKEGFAIVSMVASGECFAKDHTALAYIQPETGFFSMAVQRPLPLQRTTLDRVGNTYVLDSTGKILINHFYL